MVILRSRLLAVLIISALLLGVASANSLPNVPTLSGLSSVGVIGGWYQFTAKAIDPDGNGIKYTFDWGDDTSWTSSLKSSGQGVSTGHVWKSNGAKSVRVKATDSLGAVSVWSAPATITIGPAPVNNPPNVPSIPSGPSSGLTGTAYSYSTSATDPNGDQVKYSFNWEDGTSSTTGLVASGTAASASHSWASAGIYHVIVTATDSKGASSSVSGALSVVVSAPVITNNPPGRPYIPTGELIPMSGLVFSYYTYATDPDGDRVKYTFEWGDGTTSETAFASSGARVTASHKWTIPAGTQKAFDIAVKATDEHGVSGPWSNPQYVVVWLEKANQPPTIPSKPIGPTSGIAGTSYSYSTMSTDPDGNQIMYLFDWGDGGSTTGYFPSGDTATASHSWNKVPAGTTRTYSVTVMSADIRNMFCPAPYWSEALAVTITGPTVAPAMAIQEPQVVLLNETGVFMGDNSSPNLAGNSS